MEDYRRIYRDNTVFTLIGKQFYSKKDMLQLRSKIIQLNHQRYYRDPDPPHKRFHKTDGLIFTPDTPYHPKGTGDLYKWKYTDLVSYFTTLYKLSAWKNYIVDMF